ncbi:hypothetical protein [Paenibacillus sp. NPDC101420]|uniref:hypothetical protein n=1 Tax=Paenibacillus sp. NPDC101420 TaxID=3390602 RepID=UPI003CFD465E
MLDIEFGFYWNGVKEYSYESGLSLLGNEIVIWNPNILFSNYTDEYASTNNGYPVLDHSYSAKLYRDIERRKKEMLLLLEKGKNIFIIVPKPDMRFVPSSSSSKILDPLNIVDAMPVWAEFEHAEGYNLEFRGDELFKSFFESNKEHMKYYASVYIPEGRPFLYIKDTDLVVGTYIDYLQGKVVFIPNIIDSYGSQRNKDSALNEEEFINSIKKLNDDLKKNSKADDLPEWSQYYTLPNELEEKQKISEFQAQIDLLVFRCEEQTKLIKKLEEYKVLFTGTGKPLEQIVKKVFIELGFEVTEGLPGRDDLILKYNDKVAVVEVKGVSKSAAEKHAAQLEKWVSGYIEKFGVNPKGMLIVNSYCNLPLHERVEDTFPNQMLSYSERRDHALINTLQLLGAYLDVQKNPDRKERIIEDLFSTNGKYESYTKWLEFLEHTESENLKINTVEIGANSGAKL